MVNSIIDRDYMVVQAVTLVLAIGTILVSLLADLATLALDPRIKAMTQADTTMLLPAQALRIRWASRNALWIGIAMLTLWVLIGILGSAITPYDPIGQNLAVGASATILGASVRHG